MLRNGRITARQLVIFCVLLAAVVVPCALCAQNSGVPSTANSQADDQTPSPIDWWTDRVTDSLLEKAPRWVTFDLDTVLLDTLESSPRILGVSRRASVSLEKIIQQDAAFDPNMLFESRLGRTNDPVGNSLITGGPPRLIEQSFTTRGGFQQASRGGSVIDLSQELGLLDSNSNFFAPADQANAKLSLSLTQPLLARSGQVYTERLLTQARIDGKVSWQDMRAEVEQRIADVVDAYWRLYELRCQLLQQEALLKRGERIESLLEARRNLDAGRIELAKARQRVARRIDQKLQLQAEVEIQQARLAILVGAEELAGSETLLEMIPIESPGMPEIDINLRDALLQGIENRPEIRAAAAELESAALSIQVTRSELLPQLTAVVETYVTGLNGDFQTFNSLTDQFTTGGPGLSGGLRYDMPYGRRAARSRHREAQHRYRQRSEELREAIQVTRAEIQTALINVNTAIAQQKTKHRMLVTALDEEQILTRRWEMMAGDGATVGTVLETLLDAQQRRTDAERGWVTARIRYVSSLVDLQRAMGTLLIRKGIQPVQDPGDTTIRFIQSGMEDPVLPTPTLEGPRSADSIPADPEPADQTPADPIPAYATRAQAEPLDPEPADPKQVDPKQVDPKQVDPKQAEPEPAEPKQAEPEALARKIEAEMPLRDALDIADRSAAVDMEMPVRLQLSPTRPKPGGTMAPLVIPPARELSLPSYPAVPDQVEVPTELSEPANLVPEVLEIPLEGVEP